MDFRKFLNLITLCLGVTACSKQLGSTTEVVGEGTHGGNNGTTTVGETSSESSSSSSSNSSSSSDESTGSNTSSSSSSQSSQSSTSSSISSSDGGATTEPVTADLCPLRDNLLDASATSAGPATVQQVNCLTEFINYRLTHENPRNPGHMYLEIDPNNYTPTNAWVYGFSAQVLKSMGLAYETSLGMDPAPDRRAIMDLLILYADAGLLRRNDFLERRRMWTGRTNDPVWPNQPPGPTAFAGFTGAGDNDTAGHIANVARLILLTPEIWNELSPSTLAPILRANARRYTYLELAIVYLTEMKKTTEFTARYFIGTDRSGRTVQRFPVLDNYPDTVRPNGTIVVSRGTPVPWNQQAMINNGFQRVSEAYNLLRKYHIAIPARPRDGINTEDWHSLQDEYDQEVAASYLDLIQRYDLFVSDSVDLFFDTSETLRAGNREYVVWNYSIPAVRHPDGSGHADYTSEGLFRPFFNGKILNRAHQAAPSRADLLKLANGQVDIVSRARPDRCLPRNVTVWNPTFLSWSTLVDGNTPDDVPECSPRPAGLYSLVLRPDAYARFAPHAIRGADFLLYSHLLFTKNLIFARELAAEPGAEEEQSALDTASDVTASTGAAPIQATEKIDIGGFAPFFRYNYAGGTSIPLSLAGVENATDVKITTDATCESGEWRAVAQAPSTLAVVPAQLNTYYFQFRNASETTTCLPVVINAVKPAYHYEFSQPESIVGLRLVRGSGATFTGALGRLQRSQKNAARFEHHPALLRPIGLLVENVGTNKSLNANFNLSVAAAASPAVRADGGVTVDVVVDDAVASSVLGDFLIDRTVFRARASSGGGRVIFPGATGNTLLHSLSVYARTSTVGKKIGLGYSSRDVALKRELTDTYVRVKHENIHAAIASDEMVMQVEEGAEVFFALNQLEQGPSVTSVIPYHPLDSLFKTRKREPEIASIADLDVKQAFTVSIDASYMRSDKRTHGGLFRLGNDASSYQSAFHFATNILQASGPGLKGTTTSVRHAAYQRRGVIRTILSFGPDGAALASDGWTGLLSEGDEWKAPDDLKKTLSIGPTFNGIVRRVSIHAKPFPGRAIASLSKPPIKVKYVVFAGQSLIANLSGNTSFDGIAPLLSVSDSYRYHSRQLDVDTAAIIIPINLASGGSSAGRNPCFDPRERADMPENYWWDLVENKPGPLSARVSRILMSNLPVVDTLLWGQGETDSGWVDRVREPGCREAAKGYYKSELEATFRVFRNGIRRPDMRVVFQSLGRKMNAALSEGVQKIREVQFELAQERAKNIHVGSFVFDQVLGDNNVHLDTAGSVMAMKRLGRSLAIFDAGNGTDDYLTELARTGLRLGDLEIVPMSSTGLRIKIPLVTLGTDVLASTKLPGLAKAFKIRSGTGALTSATRATVDANGVVEVEFAASAVQNAKTQIYYLHGALHDLNELDFTTRDLMRARGPLRNPVAPAAWELRLGNADAQIVRKY